MVTAVAPGGILVPKEDYSRAHPQSALLVVEVADDSIRKDRLVKARLYALAGVPEYWIVNLPNRVVEVFRTPSSNGYLQMTTLAAGDVLSPQAFPDIVLAIDEILPTTT